MHPSAYKMDQTPQKASCYMQDINPLINNQIEAAMTSLTRSLSIAPLKGCSGIFLSPLACLNLVKIVVGTTDPFQSLELPL